MMLAYAWVYLITLALFLGIDFVWLSSMVDRFYKAEIGELMLDQPNMSAAAGFYLFYVLALLILVIVPQLRSGAGLGKVFLLGAVAGAMAYGTYDFTNLAVMKGWSLKVTLGDLAWGTLLTGTVSTISVAIARKMQWLTN
jgi:uncharacterized membrane protein